MKLHIDFETFNPTVSVRDLGAMAYASHPQTRILCAAWAVDDQEVDGSFDTDDIPAVGLRDTILAYNAHFERDVFLKLLGKDIPSDQWYDVSWRAGYFSLPRSLDGVAKVLRLTEQKDKAGKALMLRMCKDEKTHTYANLAKLLAYCKQDVATERAVYRALPEIPATCIRHARMDLRMQARGVGIDLPAVRGLKAAVDQEDAMVGARFTAITGLLPKSCVKAAEWFTARGVPLDSVGAPALAEVQDHLLTDETREALNLRKQLALACTGKLDRMLMTQVNGRCHDCTLLWGTDTGRWAGRLVQVQNFPRGDGWSPSRVEECLAYVSSLPEDPLPLLAWMWGGAAIAARSCLRGTIVAPPGSVLHVADFSQIEARIVNWLAGQDDVLEAFRAYDEKRGPDVYTLTASRLLGKPVEAVLPHERQGGKANELGGGFGMGSGKFRDTAWQQYRLRLTPEEAQGHIDFYRSTHEKVVSLWREMHTTAIGIVEGKLPGTQVGRVYLAREPRFPGNPLTIRLPSGRRLYYHSPGVGEGKYGPDISYWGLAKGAGRQTQTWTNLRTYGAKLVENVTQAVAYDLEALAMEQAEVAGFPPVLTVHDETVSEGPEASAEADAKRFLRAILTTPPWAEGLPIAAKGFVCKRYRKD